MSTPGVRARFAAMICLAAATCSPAGSPCAALAQVAEPAEASPATVRRPETARRVVAMFDFEEPGNPYPVPRHWVRTQDTPASPNPGFPAYNEPAFDFTTA